MNAYRRAYEAELTFILSGFRWTHFYDFVAESYSVVTNKQTSPDMLRRHTGEQISEITVWEYFKETGLRGIWLATLDLFGLYRIAKRVNVEHHWQGDDLEKDDLDLESWDHDYADPLTQVCRNARARYIERQDEEVPRGASR